MSYGHFRLCVVPLICDFLPRPGGFIRILHLVVLSKVSGWNIDVGHRPFTVREATVLVQFLVGTTVCAALACDASFTSLVKY